MVDDLDAMWKPGYDGPPPVVGPTRERADDQPPGSTERHEPAEPRSRGWQVAVGGALGLLVIAAVVVLGPLDLRGHSTGPAIERPDPSVFGGPAARRLPLDAAPLWSADLRSDGDHWVDVVGRELVVAAVVNSAAPPGTTIVALDAVSGEERWTSQLVARPRDVNVIGAVDGVLVLEQRDVSGSTVTGVDVVTGETRWVTDAVPNAGHLGLIGTPFIARLPSGSDRLVSLTDAASGREVGTIISDPTATGQPGGWSTDRRGTWYVTDDGEVVGYDLRGELGDADVVGLVEEVSTPGVVVDDLLVSVEDSGSITLEGLGGRSPVTVSAEVPAPVRSLMHVSGSNFVVTAPGSMAGVAVEGDSANVTWSRSEGAVVVDHPTASGTILQVATRGGAGVQLVDGSTGETVEHLTMVPGALQAVVVAGDGIVALRTSDLGANLAGIDFDGTERWAIPGSAPIVVGDRIVVRATSNGGIDENSSPPRQLRIAVYGDVG